MNLYANKNNCYLHKGQVFDFNIVASNTV